MRQSLFFVVTLDLEASLGSTQIAQSQGVPSQLRVEATGMYLVGHYAIRLDDLVSVLMSALVAGTC